ncbi:polysaccharide deacetylase family protein [Streptomyces sp. NEAU-YJ-81]|uniref:polysaccharide deacetylase family protein n=1 Tax=Streptomyces sp. NEAU-YJ-81 TaxID=2820288 RepID=UPI001ABBF924|nr:polysaccharide deacetylase family protein [Streptomyces sp. NEAU-YJ-81]MBO3681035.1 polysaccharide deacetylase family protein [Streptomyces sp. NEAU-YJ-81]
MTRTDPPTPGAHPPTPGAHPATPGTHPPTPGSGTTVGTGARRRQPRPRWPEGARCAVALTFTLDAELFWLRLHPSARHRPKTLSLGTYGIRRGVPRLLELLDEYALPATWFVPERTALHHPDAVRRIAAAGHEIAAAAPPVPGETPTASVRETWSRTADLLESVAGVRPTGLRAAPGVLGDGHAALLDELGFGWSSSTHGDDRPHRLWSAGRPTPVVELPWLWEYADHPYFLYNGGPVAFPPGESRIAAYGDVLADWKDSFDAFRDHGLCWIPALDPQSIGKPAGADARGTAGAHPRTRRRVVRHGNTGGRALAADRRSGNGTGAGAGRPPAAGEGRVALLLAAANGAMTMRRGAVMAACAGGRRQHRVKTSRPRVSVASGTASLRKARDLPSCPGPGPLSGSRAFPAPPGGTS